GRPLRGPKRLACRPLLRPPSEPLGATNRTAPPGAGMRPQNGVTHRPRGPGGNAVRLLFSAHLLTSFFTSSSRLFICTVLLTTFPSGATRNRFGGSTMPYCVASGLSRPLPCSGAWNRWVPGAEHLRTASAASLTVLSRLTLTSSSPLLP